MSGPHSPARRAWDSGPSSQGEEGAVAVLPLASWFLRVSTRAAAPGAGSWGFLLSHTVFGEGSWQRKC